jgi:hypothetical protein
MVVARICAASDDTGALRDALATASGLNARLRAAGLPVQESLLDPVAGQLAWLEGRQEDAEALWRGALAQEPAINVYGQAAETRLRLARALLRRQDLPGAAAVLQPALAAGRADQGPGGALLAAEALRELASAAWSAALPAADVALLRDWMRMLEAGALAPVAPESDLSARELEVLARIAAGESNKLIACPPSSPYSAPPAPREAGWQSPCWPIRGDASACGPRPAGPRRRRPYRWPAPAPRSWRRTWMSRPACGRRCTVQTPPSASPTSGSTWIPRASCARHTTWPRPPRRRASRTSSGRRWRTRAIS